MLKINQGLDLETVLNLNSAQSLPGVSRFQHLDFLI